MKTGTIESDGMLTPWFTMFDTASRSAPMLRAARMGRFASPPSSGLFIDTPMKYTPVLGYALTVHSPLLVCGRACAEMKLPGGMLETSRSPFWKARYSVLMSL